MGVLLSNLLSVLAKVSRQNERMKHLSRSQERSPVKPAQPEEAGPTASEVAHLRKLLAAAEDERDRARQQLNR